MRLETKAMRSLTPLCSAAMALLGTLSPISLRLSLTVLLVAIPAPLAAQQSSAFEGTWEVAGSLEDGSSPYQGSTRIRAENGAFFVEAEAGEIRLSGIGMMDGDSLFVGLGSWTRGAKAVGIFSYALLPDGVLDGRWFSIDGQGVGYEKGVSGGHEGLVGSYQVQGRGPGNSGAYRGTLTISNRTPGYWFDWDLGKLKYRGIGIEHAGQYYSSWCITGVCILARYQIAGETLEGSLLRSDSPLTQKEKLTRIISPQATP